MLLAGAGREPKTPTLAARSAPSGCAFAIPRCRRGSRHRLESRRTRRGRMRGEWATRPMRPVAREWSSAPSCSARRTAWRSRWNRWRQERRQRDWNDGGATRSVYPALPLISKRGLIVLGPSNCERTRGLTESGCCFAQRLGRRLWLESVIEDGLLCIWRVQVGWHPARGR